MISMLGISGELYSRKFVSDFDKLEKSCLASYIPVDQGQDKLIWNHVTDHNLAQKKSYNFKSQHYNSLSWKKNIWSTDIPPSKSFLV